MTPEQENKLDKIYNALVSDKALGHVGLIERLENVENKQKADDNMKLKITGGIIVLSAVGSVAVSFVFWFVNKFWS